MAGGGERLSQMFLAMSGPPGRAGGPVIREEVSPAVWAEVGESSHADNRAEVNCSSEHF